MTKWLWLRPIVWWAYSAIAMTGAFSAIYIAVQQDLRQSANDPQIAMAEDAATQLAVGGSIVSVVTRNAPLLNVKTTQLPWIAVYDAQGNVINASGQLDEHLPQPPKSLFDTSNWVAQKTWTVPTGYETRVTWQPQPDIRQAIVLVHYKSQQGEGYVVAGRSMRLTEERIIQLGENLLLTWAFTLACLFVASFIGEWVLRR